jgi:transcriptional regulator with XRE-family HTH domain
MQRRRRTQFDLDGDREARSLALSLGQTMRDARRRRRWSQEQLAAKVGLKRTRIGDIERGEATGTPLVVWVRLGIALRRPIAISFSRDLDAMTPSDAGHLEGQELVLRLARVAGRTGTFELPTRPESPSNSVDVCVRDGPNRTLILHEIWNRFDDFGRAVRSMDRKTAEAAALAAVIGGDNPYRVASCWLLVDNAGNRQMLRRFPEVFTSRFPGSSLKWVDALTNGGPAPEDAGIAWLDLRASRLVPIRAARRLGARDV